MARLISTCACVTTALLSFGLVCGRALIKTRHILFSNLEFTKNEDFEQFLKLVDAPWTSFTLAIKEIHLADLFHPHDHDYRDQIDYKDRIEPLQRQVTEHIRTSALDIWMESHPPLRPRCHLPTEDP